MASDLLMDVPTLSESRLAVLSEIGGPEFIADLLQDFIRNFEIALVELDDCMLNQDAKRVAYLCHSTRTSALNVGATSLAIACKQVEDWITQSPINWASAKSLINEIKVQAPALRTAISLDTGVRIANL